MRFAEILRQVADQIEAHEEPANTIAPIEPVVAPEIEVQVEPATPPADDINNLMRLAGNQNRINTTIAQPAGQVKPINPVFISPLQQQLELQKQQGGKASPHINQIIDNTTLGSTAGEQPEQSVYNDSPLKPGEYVGASTGAVGKLSESKSIKGANKSRYRR